ncbi:MAG: hypothetical protein JWQ04_2833 [Pedosphaera sp.]|nr:hypothetical protein [Pedosphaera sp.]
MAETNCQQCGTPVHIGPKLRELVKQYPQLTVMCFKCAILAEGGVKPTVLDMGGQGGDYLVRR